jgi:hypothetical protein
LQVAALVGRDERRRERAEARRETVDRRSSFDECVDRRSLAVDALEYVVTEGDRLETSRDRDQLLT